MKTIRYTCQLGNCIDLLATIPYFIIVFNASATIENKFSAAPWVLATGSSTILTVRIARCFRLLKILDVHPQGSPKLSLIIRTVRQSFSSLLILLGFVFISGIILGSLIYATERGDFMITPEFPEGQYMRYNLNESGYEVSPFSNLGRCMYWAIVTMTTLGYGDLYPTTTSGRFITSLGCLYGVLVISLPVTIVNNAFSTEMTAYQVSIAAEKVRLRQKAKLETLAAQVAQKLGTKQELVQKIDNNSLMNDSTAESWGSSKERGRSSPSQKYAAPYESGATRGTGPDSPATDAVQGSMREGAYQEHDLPFRQPIKASTVHTQRTRRSSFIENLKESSKKVPDSPEAKDTTLIKEARSAGVISKEYANALLAAGEGMAREASREVFSLEHVVNADEHVDDGVELREVGVQGVSSDATIGVNADTAAQEAASAAINASSSATNTYAPQEEETTPRKMAHFNDATGNENSIFAAPADIFNDSNDRSADSSESGDSGHSDSEGEGDGAGSDEGVESDRQSAFGRESMYNEGEVREIMGKIRAARVALDDLEVSLYKHF